MEDRFAALDGVVDAVSGYMGGHQDHPTYEQVCSGDTGHAETVEVKYDPAEVSYAKLVALFFALHDPTTPNQQGPNRGTQYRSVVFSHSEEESQEVSSQIRALEAKKAYGGRPIVTQVIETAPQFWTAEDYHQDYYQKHRGFCSF